MPRNRSAYFSNYNKLHKHSRRASRWCNRGLNASKEDAKAISRLLDEQTRCWICDVEFSTTDNNRMPVLDHDHKTGEFRYIACNLCNKTILRSQKNKPIS